MTAATLRRRISTCGPGRSRAARRWNIPGEATVHSCRAGNLTGRATTRGRRRLQGLLTGAGPLAVRDMAARPSDPRIPGVPSVYPS